MDTQQLDNVREMDEYGEHSMEESLLEEKSSGDCDVRDDEHDRLKKTLSSESSKLLEDGGGWRGSSVKCQEMRGQGKSSNFESSHASHFRRKYTLRSDSVHSDVTPEVSRERTTRIPESLETSGSLPSLKPQSKWLSLKKKLGKLNHPKSKPSDDNVASCSPDSTSASLSNSAKKQLAQKRSLLQRAKTLSILPVNRATKEEAVVTKKEVKMPPELFNVGGEMNLIPLEMLIDINDLNIKK